MRGALFRPLGAVAVALLGCQGARSEPVDASRPEAGVIEVPRDSAEADSSDAMESDARKPERGFGVQVFPTEPSVRPGGSLQLVSHVAEGSYNQFTLWSV